MNGLHSAICDQDWKEIVNTSIVQAKKELRPSGMCFTCQKETKNDDFYQHGADNDLFKVSCLNSPTCLVPLCKECLLGDGFITGEWNNKCMVCKRAAIQQATPWWLPATTAADGAADISG